MPKHSTGATPLLRWVWSRTRWSTPKAMVTDFCGEVVAPPLKFALTVSGVAALRARTAAAVEERAAVLCRVEVETAGHYHRT